MKELASDIAQVLADIDLTDHTRRDRLGRYMATPAQGKKPKPFSRATTIAGTLEDTYNLEKRSNRYMAAGFALNADLVSAARALDPETDKDALNKICSTAAYQAGASYKAEYGTALHHCFAMSVINPDYIAPASFTAEVLKIHAALTLHGFTIVDGMVERMILNRHLGIAGTFDLIVTDGNELFIADLKSGNLAFGALKMAIQGSIYAQPDNVIYNQGPAEDGTQDTEEPMPVVSAERSLIINAVHGKPVTLHWLDLNIGDEGLRLALETRAIRNAKPLQQLTEPDPAAKAIALAEKHFPGSTRIEYVDDTWRGQVGIRLIAIVDIGAGNDVLANWPDGVPSLKSKEPLTLEQGEQIVRLIADVERQHGIAFPDEQTVTPIQRTKATSSRKPAAVEGDLVDQALIDALQAEAQLLPDNEWQWISTISQEATAANREIRLGGPAGKTTQRRFAIGQALIILAPQLDDELTRVLVSHATGEPINTTATLGDLIGQLNADQATRFARLAHAIDDLALTLAYSDAGEVQIAGDIEAVLAA